MLSRSWLYDREGRAAPEEQPSNKAMQLTKRARKSVGPARVIEAMRWTRHSLRCWRALRGHDGVRWRPSSEPRRTAAEQGIFTSAGSCRWARHARHRH